MAILMYTLGVRLPAVGRWEREASDSPKLQTRRGEVQALPFPKLTCVVPKMQVPLQGLQGDI